MHPPQHQNIAVRQNKRLFRRLAMNNWLICEISHSNCLVCKFFMGVVNSAWWQMQRAACYKINQVQASLLLCLKEFTQFLNDHVIIVETHWFIHTHTRLHFHVFFFFLLLFFCQESFFRPNTSNTMSYVYCYDYAGLPLNRFVHSAANI